MGQNFNFESAIPASFTVTPDQVGTSLVISLTISDAGYKLTTQKMIRAVLKKAIDTYVAAESADFVTNGDTAITTGLETDYHPGDGYALWTFDYTNKLAKVSVTAITGLDLSTPFSAAGPFIYSH